jgi:response regulator RpfG family c-di-GMP phosphodiesterase
MNGKSLLVVDDESMFLDLVEQCVEDDFEHIVKATSIEEAKDKLMQKMFDAILVDIDLSDGNGAEIIKYIADWKPCDNDGTPIVVMSGLINDQFQSKFKDKFAGILPKPFKPGDLQATLLIALGKTKRSSKGNGSLSLIGEEESAAPVSNGKESSGKKAPDKKIEIEFEKEKVSVDIFDPQVNSPFKIENLSKKVNSIIKKKVQQNAKLKDLFKKIKVDPDDPYMMTHIGLLINITTGISKQMDWGSEQTLEKFILASYLHDLALGDSTKLARLGSREDIEKHEDLTPEEKKLVELHAIASKTLVENKREIPQDVHTIIEQHHERPDGKGYPNGLDHKRITPLSSIFIVAHLLTDYIIDNPNWSIDKFVMKYKTCQKGPHFRKVFRCLDELR